MAESRTPPSQQPKLTTAEDAERERRQPTAAEINVSEQEREKGALQRPPAQRSERNPNEADFYRVSAGLTSTRGVHTHGEIVSHEEMGAGFTALSEEEQLARFGRVMYVKHDVDENLVRRHGVQDLHTRLGTQSPEVERQAKLQARGEVTDPGKLKELDDDELWEMARLEGLEFPRETPRRSVEGAITKRLRQKEEELEDAKDASYRSDEGEEEDDGDD